MTRAREHATRHCTSFWARRHGDGPQLVPGDSCEEQGTPVPAEPTLPSRDRSALAVSPDSCHHPARISQTARSVGIVVGGGVGGTVSGIRHLLPLFLREKLSL